MFLFCFSHCWLFFVSVLSHGWLGIMTFFVFLFARLPVADLGFSLLNVFNFCVNILEVGFDSPTKLVSGDPRFVAKPLLWP